MRCFIAAERTALEDMWRLLSKDYYLDPDLVMMLVESLGTYLYVRWDLERNDKMHHMDVYLEDLLQAALLTHIPRHQVLHCWDGIYTAILPSMREFFKESGKVRGVNPLLKENQQLLGIMVFG